MNQSIRALLSATLLCAVASSTAAQDITLTIATVDNRDMIRMQELSGAFTQANPDIALAWITLDENVLRQRVTTDISVGFALAPDRGLGKRSLWLWSWALAVPKGSHQVDAAKRFVAWATSSDYTQLVAERDGWANVPPGTRTSLYDNEKYLEAAPFAQMTLASIEAADPDNPTVDEVPYTGMQFVAIPEFQAIGTAVGQQFSKALAGEIPTTEAIENAQWVTGKVMERTRLLED